MVFLANFCHFWYPNRATSICERTSFDCRVSTPLLGELSSQQMSRELLGESTRRRPTSRFITGMWTTEAQGYFFLKAGIFEFMNGSNKPKVNENSPFLVRWRDSTAESPEEIQPTKRCTLRQAQIYRCTFLCNIKTRVDPGFCYSALYKQLQN